MDGSHGLFEEKFASAVTLLTQLTCIVTAELLAEPFKVFNRTQYARNAFVILRAGFELAGQFVGGRTNFVGDEFFK